MIFFIPEYNKPREKSSVKHTPHALGVKEGKEVDFKLLTKTNNMSWRQGQKEEYSFYVTGFVIVMSIALVVGALIQQTFFK